MFTEYLYVVGFTLVMDFESRMSRVHGGFAEV